MRSTQHPLSPPHRGLYTYVGVGGGYDSVAKYSGELDLSVGYEFGRRLEIAAGMPFFFLSMASNPDANGARRFSSRYSSFGDTFVMVKITHPTKLFGYSETVTVTAPTGSKDASAGRVTWDWRHRVENDVWHLHPFGEFDLGNAPLVPPKLARQLRAGNTFPLTKALSFDASVYEAIPIGNSKVKAIPPAPGSVLRDRGFTGSLSMSTIGRFEYDLTYSRSMVKSANALYITVGYRAGHVRGLPSFARRWRMW